jgi:hypothetical protein
MGNVLAILLGLICIAGGQLMVLAVYDIII